ncbi:MULTISPECIES: hypothetical protein [Solibacillus]|uniref:Uncharacterized protein n=1 Tax=Solibacillus merdavium TaxID=2762218 RepID=A0ABR8XJA1_9BACL|nr:hypothetical protein [Solibacillus merdavium]MBD8032012.1 hypothetical protein [Solibacillus merdavium]
MNGLKFLDEKIIALRNEMREQEKHELAQKEAALQQELEPQQENQQTSQQVDLTQDFVKINELNIPVISQSVLKGNMIIRMPKLFSIMAKELASLKYPSERRPNVIYTDETSTINLALNLTDYPLRESEVVDFQENMIEVLEQAHPSAKWLDTGMMEVQGKTIAFIEVITPAIDGEIFNLMFFAALDGQTLIGTFNCMEGDLETWRPIAKAMVETLQFPSNDKNGVRKA